MKTLVIAVGGGNDSVSAFWILEQLRQDYKLTISHLDLLSMLPPGVEYHNIEPTVWKSIFKLNTETYRTINQKPIRNLPEATLAKHLKTLNITHLYGLELLDGPMGAFNALQPFLTDQDYEQIYFIDVGGDFITIDQNPDILSPYMDACMGFAAKLLAPRFPITGVVFGLGLDGESSPECLIKAICQLNPKSVGTLSPYLHHPINEIYTNEVDPIRPSQTGKLLAQYQRTAKFPLEHQYTRTFHLPDGSTPITFHQTNRIDPTLASQYLIFDDFSRLNNRYLCPASSPLDWLYRTQSHQTLTYNELIGQLIQERFICLPSHQFKDHRKQIVFATYQGSCRYPLAPKPLFYLQDLVELSLPPLAADNIS